MPPFQRTTSFAEKPTLTGDLVTLRPFRDDDLGAEAALERLEELLGGNAVGDLARMRECIENLDYAEALEPLSRIAATLGLTAEA